MCCGVELNLHVLERVFQLLQQLPINRELHWHMIASAIAIAS